MKQRAIKYKITVPLGNLYHEMNVEGKKNVRA